VFVNKVEKTPQLLKFHPYTSHLAVMHKSDWRFVCLIRSCWYDHILLLCSVWDIEDGTKLVAQYNSPARITAAKFLNPHDISFLLTGSGLFGESINGMNVLYHYHRSVAGVK
jgi:hypothetical protein